MAQQEAWFVPITCEVLGYAFTVTIRDPSRRDVLLLAGTTALVWGCGDNLVTRPAGHSHAAAMLEPDEGSFLVSAWSSIARSFTIDVQDRGELVRSVRVAVNGAQQALVAIDGLAPSTEYQVTLTSDDATLLGPYRVYTAPTPDDPRPVRLAVSAD